MPNQSSNNIQAETANVDGDIVGRDKIFNLNITEGSLAKFINQSSEENPLKQEALDSLRQFKVFHSTLRKWKDLHHSLSRVLISLDQFSVDVDNRYREHQAGNSSELQSSWDQVVYSLKDLELSVKNANQVFSSTHSNSNDLGNILQIMFKTLSAKRESISDLLKPKGFGLKRLKPLSNVTREFSSNVKFYLGWTDDQLRNNAGELDSLSSKVLGGLAP